MHFRLGVGDLAATSFAYSPLNETVASLRVRKHPELYPEHLPFRRATAASFAGLATELLDALIGENRWTPDFLTPRPSGPLMSLADELATLAETLAGTVSSHLADAYRGAAIPPVLRRPPAKLVPAIVEALSDYWTACVQPWWPRIDAVLEADVVHRARQLARGGAAALFGDLAANLTWSDGVLGLDRPVEPIADPVDVAGQGLILVPTIFARHAAGTVSEHELPWLLYPARGRATVWESAPAPAPRALAGILGDVRARLLLRLGSPATTGDLATAFNVTPSAISQHLSALRDARLVNRSRAGRTVLYFRSPLGDALVGEG